MQRTPAQGFGGLLSQEGKWHNLFLLYYLGLQGHPYCATFCMPDVSAMGHFLGYFSVLVMMMHWVLCRVVAMEMFGFDKDPSGRNCN